MQEPTDDQLDGLFRKSGEEFDVPFDPAAWQDLKSRLDNHDRYSAWEHTLRWGLPVLLLLILTAGSWNAYHKQVLATSVNRPQPDQVNGPSLPRSVAVTPAVSVPPVSAKQPGPEGGQEALRTTQTAGSTNPAPGNQAALSLSQPDGRELPTSSASEVRSANRQAIPASTGDDSRPGPDTDVNPVGTVGTASPASDSRVLDRTRSAGSLPTLATTTTRGKRLRSGRDKRSVRQTEIPVGALASNAPAIPYPNRSSTTPTNQSVSIKRASREIHNNPDSYESLPATGSQTAADAASPTAYLSFEALSSRPGQWPKPLPFRGREIAAPEPAQLVEPQAAAGQPVSSPRGLSVRFAVSPDLSGIGLREIQRPGTNVGLLVEYRLAPRWVIQAGALRSTKVYKAYPSDYEWPSNWTSPVRPLSVDGSCKMFDVPVNLRYDLAIRPRSDGRLPDRWFISGGATMYYMNQEDYVYTYPAHTYNVPKEWHGKTGWNGFSQLNLSGGFERSFSRRLSWQVEPFMKVPLKGIGFFKIDLLSTGAFFSLRYKL
jgi:hypothetical protein